MVFRMNKAEIFVMGGSCPASTEAEAEAKAISEHISKKYSNQEAGKVDSLPHVAHPSSCHTLESQF